MKIEIKIGKDTTKEGKWSEKEETDLRHREEVKRKLYLYVFELFWNYLSRVTWNNIKGWGNAIKKQWITYLNPNKEQAVYVCTGNIRVYPGIKWISEGRDVEMKTLPNKSWNEVTGKLWKRCLGELNSLKCRERGNDIKDENDWNTQNPQ